MENTDIPNTPPTSSGKTNEENFLQSTPASDTNIYGDFFQETSDGNISIGSKAQKSGIEVFTMVLSYAIPVVIVLTILMSIHVFIRNRDKADTIENYQFICPYLNYGINVPSDEKKCKTINMVAQDYEAKQVNIQNDIIDTLTQYIPIKTSNSIIDASPEKNFVLETYKNKIHIDEIIENFNKAVITGSNKSVKNNIECNGINITKELLTTQCTIYGWIIGASDTFWSARIETLKFAEYLANTPISHFVLMNPPTSLSVEKVDPETATNPQFQTRTTIPIQVRYSPIIIKP
jgi:hypothetical protein